MPSRGKIRCVTEHAVGPPYHLVRCSRDDDAPTAGAGVFLRRLLRRDRLDGPFASVTDFAALPACYQALK